MGRGLIVDLASPDALASEQLEQKREGTDACEG
jgi:hypothetical protein